MEGVDGIVRQANRVPIRAGSAGHAWHGTRRRGVHRRGGAQQCEEAALRGAQAPPLHRGRRRAGPALAQERCAGLGVAEGGAELQHRRVDVGLAADGRGVAQAPGDLRDDLLGGPARALADTGVARELQGQHAAVPGPEVLRGDAHASRLREVVVDVGGRDAAHAQERLMTRPDRHAPLLLILLLVVACGKNQPAAAPRVSGHVEATDVTVAPDVAGRILELRPKEGDRITGLRKTKGEA